MYMYIHVYFCMHQLLNSKSDLKGFPFYETLAVSYLDHVGFVCAAKLKYTEVKMRLHWFVQAGC